MLRAQRACQLGSVGRRGRRKRDGPPRCASPPKKLLAAKVRANAVAASAFQSPHAGSAAAGGRAHQLGDRSAERAVRKRRARGRTDALARRRRLDEVERDALAHLVVVEDGHLVAVAGDVDVLLEEPLHVERRAGEARAQPRAHVRVQVAQDAVALRVVVRERDGEAAADRVERVGGRVLREQMREELAWLDLGRPKREEKGRRTSSTNSSRQARRRTVKSSSMTVMTPRLHTRLGKLDRRLPRYLSAVARTLAELLVAWRSTARTWLYAPASMACCGAWLLRRAEKVDRTLSPTDWTASASGESPPPRAGTPRYRKTGANAPASARSDSRRRMAVRKTAWASVTERAALACEGTAAASSPRTASTERACPPEGDLRSAWSCASASTRSAPMPTTSGGERLATPRRAARWYSEIWARGERKPDRRHVYQKVRNRAPMGDETTESGSNATCSR